MQIIIEYESSWRNSFLEGSNNEPLPKKGRNYLASNSKLDEDPKHYIEHKITFNTIMGILNRLIGDQRKLYQAKEQNNYFFKDVEPKISFKDKNVVESNEIVYIRNMTGNTDRNSFSGPINDKHELFTSDYSKELWKIISLDFNYLIKFILEGEIQNEADAILDPALIIDIIKEFKDIKLEKILEIFNLDKNEVNEASNYLKNNRELNKQLKNQFPALQKTFSDINYVTEDKVILRAFYCSSLYLQALRLSKIYSMDGVLLKGFSVNGFTPKDFMKPLTKGMKMVWGNPYIREEFIKGEGKVRRMLTKASGQLEIHLNIPNEKARELKDLIDSAGVSSFYLGKKGLAYVSAIRV